MSIQGEARAEADTILAAGYRKVVLTEDKVLRAAHALMRDDPEAERGTYGLEDYLAMARAALEAALGGGE